MLDQRTDVADDRVRAIAELVIGNRPRHRWQVPIRLLCAQSQRKATLSNEAPTTTRSALDALNDVFLMRRDYTSDDQRAPHLQAPHRRRQDYDAGRSEAPS